jgi:Cft2 family RNA processing exonuclease
LDIYLDPKKAQGVSFISHAHSDHCPRSFSGTLIASSKTCALMRKEPKGECWHKTMNIDNVGFSLYNSGHIPGSMQLLIENGSRILYTGDLNINGGLITPRAETPRCDILIIEATFGTPRYSFPDKVELVKEMRDWARTSLSKGKIPVLLGYSLGKGQELTKALSNDFSVFVEESVYAFNKRTESLGIDLGAYRPMSEFSNKEDSVLIVPPQKGKNFSSDRYSPAFASGWTVNGGWWLRRFPHGFPLSDHSDFYDLVRFVEKVSPQVVYTTHGYAREFSQYIRERGFYSEPLSLVQKKLEDF